MARPFQEVRILSSRPGRTRLERASKSLAHAASGGSSDVATRMFAPSKFPRALAPKYPAASGAMAVSSSWLQT